MKTKKKKSSAIWKVLGLFLVLTLITGICYPAVVTGIAQAAFQDKANGSVIEIDGKKYGSVLLAQEFSGDEYLWGRIMNVDTATYVNDQGEALMYAGPSNLSPASEEYKALVEERVSRLKAADPSKEDAGIPVELVTCSGSGLDPHISPAAAKYQVSRIANARNMTEDEVREVIERYTEGRFLGVLGEKTVNVLEVNLALDGILKQDQ